MYVSDHEELLFVTDELIRLLCGIYCRLEFYNGCHARHNSPDVATFPPLPLVSSPDVDQLPVS